MEKKQLQKKEMQEMIRLKEIEIEEKRGAGEMQMQLNKLNKTSLKIPKWGNQKP